MVFSSMVFLFAFLPITFAVYFFLPKKFQNYWLLLASLFFYAWGEPSRVFLLLFSIALNYFGALKLEETTGKIRKLILVLVLIVNLGLLFCFKYLNFATISLHQFIPATQEMFDLTNIALPIGISFFTFQAISYVVDVYRGRVKAQKNICYLGLYISFFPQLVAGPIVRYSTIADQIENRKHRPDAFAEGMLRFIKGINKKVLIANVLSAVADSAFASETLSIGLAWLGAVCYALQIYFDFSGYSDMAIGLGKMAGFTFLENFNLPYQAKSVSDFWRRWHISLGSWFRDYVYFPLGGSRVSSSLRLVFNLMVVWLLTGIWHGADWTFMLWGVMYGVLISLEKLLGIEKKLQNKKVLSFLYQLFTLLVVLLGWVLFRAEHISQAIYYLKSLFGLAGNALTDITFRFNLREYAFTMALGLLIVFFPYGKLKEKTGSSGKWSVAISVVQVILFIFSISCLVMQTNNPFIYFNF